MFLSSLGLIFRVPRNSCSHLLYQLSQPFSIYNGIQRCVSCLLGILGEESCLINSKAISIHSATSIIIRHRLQLHRSVSSSRQNDDLPGHSRFLARWDLGLPCSYLQQILLPFYRNLDSCEGSCSEQHSGCCERILRDLELLCRHVLTDHRHHEIAETENLSGQFLSCMIRQ